MVHSICYNVSPLFVPCLGKGTVHAETPNSAVVLGLRQATYTWEAVSELASQTDFEKRFVTMPELPTKTNIGSGFQKEVGGGGSYA